MENDIALIVPDNFRTFGDKVDKHLQELTGSKESFVIKPNLIRFNNGEGKCIVDDEIRGKDVYILSDVSNHSITYEALDGISHMSPDEHFQDIKRIINSLCGHANRITVITPYLYQSRQDKRKGKESLDLAMSLGELRHYGVSEVVAADLHNKAACDNASPNMSINNFYCSDDILLDLIKNEKINFNNTMVVAPDTGAFDRASFYSSIMGNMPVGVFYKQRDYDLVDGGLNPVTKHEFMHSGSVKGKDAIVVDDMIASGGSIIDTADQLKEKGIDRVFLLATFGLFTKGPAKFDKAYNEGKFNRVYATNLNYVPQNILNLDWFKQVDCSDKVATIIYNMHNNKSIGKLLNAKENTIEKIKVLRREYS